MSTIRRVRYRVTGWARRHVAAIALLTVAIAIVAAAVLALAAGARRTATAPDRYQAAFSSGYELRVTQEDGVPRTHEVAALPAVGRLEAMTWMFAIALEGEQPIDAYTFAGSIGAADSRLVAGRQPASDRIDEFLASEDSAAAAGLSLGDRVSVVSLTSEGLAELTQFAPEQFDGPTWEAELVGLMRGPSELDDSTLQLLFSPRALELGAVAVGSTLMSVELADGSTTTELRRQLDQLPAANQFRIEPARTVSDEIRTAVRGQSVGLWLVTVLGGIAALATLGLLLTRTVRLSADEQRSLAALGYSRTDLVIETAGRAALVVAIAMPVAVVIAVAVSGLFPFGFSRHIEPSPGVRWEWIVLLITALCVTVALVTGVSLATAVRPPHRLGARSSAVGGLAARSPSATVATGLRFAFAGRAGSASLVTVGATMLGVAALAGTLTFGASLTGLIDDPARYGTNFDAMMDNGADTIQPEFLQYAVDNPDVADIELYRSGLARVDDTTIPVITSESLRGDVKPGLIEGRLPSGADEIAIGGVSSQMLDAGVGDTLRLSTPGATLDLEVVGISVTPGIRGFDLLGQGSYVDDDAFDPLFPETVEPQTAALRFDAASDAGAVLADAAVALGAAESDIQLGRPGAITNLDRIRFVPYTLASMLLVLSIMTLVGSLWTGMRRREQQAAVLRALGADPRWLRGVAVWQALAFTVIPTVVAGGLGVIAGRLVYRNFAESKGVLPVTEVPTALGAAGLTLMLGVAVVTTLSAGRRSRGGQPANMLRTG